MALKRGDVHRFWPCKHKREERDQINNQIDDMHQVWPCKRKREKII